VSKFRGYKAFFDKALQAHMAYGGSLLMSLFAQAVAFGITIMIWNYALKERGQASQIFAYLTLAFMLNYAFNLFLERTIGERIREGLVATDLLKPIDFQLFYAVQSLSDMIFQILLALIVFGMGLAYLGSQLFPASLPALAYFGISLILAFAVQYGLCFCFVQGIFLTNSNYGVFATRGALHQTFSGAFAPLAFFPPSFLIAAKLMPFHCVIHTPAALYLGMIPLEAAPFALAEQAAWALGLILLGRFLFSRILGKLAIQGG
jgi:ABC-2 type transport system permease protein